MSDDEAVTPRVILFRHGEFCAEPSRARPGLETWRRPHVNSTHGTGETEWARSGRFTGITEIDLTQQGVTQVSSAASRLVGAGEVIDPSRLAHTFVSPRKRAKRTFELLSLSAELNEKAFYTEDIAEWDYGEYEGLDKQQIRALMKERGLDAEWDIWSDGCDGGEYMASFSAFDRALFTDVLKITVASHRTPRQIHLGDQRKATARYARRETQRHSHRKFLFVVITLHTLKGELSGRTWSHRSVLCEALARSTDRSLSPHALPTGGSGGFEVCMSRLPCLYTPAAHARRLALTPASLLRKLQGQ